MIQIKTFYSGLMTDAAEAASAWLRQQDGKITVKSIMTDFGGAMIITIVYETFDGARLSDGIPSPAA